MKKEVLKIATIFLITVGVVLWGLNYIFFGPAPKSKAAGETITFSFNPATKTVAVNTDFTVSLMAKPSINTVLRGYVVKVGFDKTKVKFKSIVYKLGVVSAGLGNTDAQAVAINGNGVIEIIGESTTAIGSAVTAVNGAEIASLTFTALSTAGSSISTSSSDFFAIGSDKILFAGWTSVPGNLSVNSAGVTNTPTPTPTGGLTPSPTPTGGATGNVKLNLKLKFQGINKKPPTEELNFIKGKIEGKIIGTNEGFTSTTEGNFLVKSDDNGVWSGTVGIYLPQSALGKKFTLYIKGRRHIQKKICDSVPTETSPGTYRCPTGNITLVAGDNNLDFSGILLLVGDLDQTGIVDSVDFSLVKNCLSKSDSVCVNSSDLNLDGKVDTQDFSLIIAALGIRTDEQ